MVPGHRVTLNILRISTLLVFPDPYRLILVWIYIKTLNYVGIYRYFHNYAIQPHDSLFRRSLLCSGVFNLNLNLLIFFNGISHSFSLLSVTFIFLKFNFIQIIFAICIHSYQQ